MKVGEAESFIGKISPPRLEAAGLEDCALPPESIREAFMKAAEAVKSVTSAAAEGVGSEGRCVVDPWEESSDALVGLAEGVIGQSEGCNPEKGGRSTEVPGDKLVVGGGGYGDASVDAVIGPVLPAIDDACVDGLMGLGNDEKCSGSAAKKRSDMKKDDDDRDRSEPTLAEGYAV